MIPKITLWLRDGTVTPVDCLRLTYAFPFSYSTSVMLKIVYGKSTPTAIASPDVIAAINIVKRLSDIMRPGYFLVDMFPFLKYVPGYGRVLKKWRAEESEYYHRKMNEVKHRMVSRHVLG